MDLSSSCPSCGSEHVRMSFSRLGKNGYRVRRRECRDCCSFFTTIELPEAIADAALNAPKAARKAALLVAADALQKLAAKT